MPSEEILKVAAVLGSTVVASRTLAGGFSHQTCLLTLSDGQVVVRLGGVNPGLEAAVMTLAGRTYPCRGCCWYSQRQVKAPGR